MVVDGGVVVGVVSGGVSGIAAVLAVFVAILGGLVCLGVLVCFSCWFCLFDLRFACAVSCVRRRLCVLETTWVQLLLSSMWLHSASPVCRCLIFSIVQLVVGDRGGLVLRVCLGWISSCSLSFVVVSAFGLLFMIVDGGVVGGVISGGVSVMTAVLAVFVAILGGLVCLGFRPLVAALLPISSHSESVVRCCVCAVLCVRAHC